MPKLEQFKKPINELRRSLEKDSHFYFDETTLWPYTQGLKNNSWRNIQYAEI